MIITHDPEIAAQAEWVIRIKDGRITEDYRNESRIEEDEKNPEDPASAGDGTK